ncbi:MAG: hypothetical protein IJ443_07955, partial [Firmicutes bacterium]|nr:hypothetical protein [Bacillota bacterium]
TYTYHLKSLPSYFEFEFKFEFYSAYFTIEIPSGKPSLKTAPCQMLQKEAQTLQVLPCSFKT